MEQLKTTPEKIEELEKSRLNVLKQSENLPASAIFGRQIRKKFKETVLKDGHWPETPNKFKNIYDFFSLASQAVADTWRQKTELNQESADDLLQQKAKGWLEKMPAEDKKNNPDVVAILAEPQKLEEQLKQQRLGVLEPLRELMPEAWETLTMVSSERQLAKIAISKHWLKELPDSAFNQQESSRTELLLLNDIAALTGKLIDHGYLKQDELNENISLNNNGNKENLEAAAGRKYIYHFKTPNGQIKLTPFKDVLPFELEKFDKNLKFLADKTEKLLKENKLPNTYQHLPNYLLQLAKTYNSPETDEVKLYNQWEKLYQTNAELLRAGCPLVINPQEDDPFDVVSLELRLGLRAKELRVLEEKSAEYLEAAYNLKQQLRQENPQAAAEPLTKSDLILNNQIYAFGTSLQFPPQAESYHNQIFIHANEIENVAQNSEIPLLKKLLPREKFNSDEFIRQAILETSRHEIGHTVLAAEEKNVMNKIGESQEAGIIEELKAETISFKLAEKNLSNLPETEIRLMLLAKVGTLLDYLTNKSQAEGAEGEDYYLCGVKLISELLEKNIIKIENNNTLTLTDARAGVEKIIKIGDHILDIYKDKNTTPQKITAYVNGIRKLKNNSRFKQFIKILK